MRDSRFTKLSQLFFRQSASYVQFSLPYFVGSFDFSSDFILLDFLILVLSKTLSFSQQLRKSIGNSSLPKIKNASKLVNFASFNDTPNRRPSFRYWSLGPSFPSKNHFQKSLPNSSLPKIKNASKLVNFASFNDTRNRRPSFRY